MQTEKLNIFVDAHCFDNEYQGTVTFLKEIYAELIRKKDLHFFIAAFDVSKLNDCLPEADNVTHIKYSFRSRILRLSYEIPRLIRKYKIDYAHFQYITPLVKNSKQIVTIHDVIFSDYPDEFSAAYRKLKKYLYSRSAKNAEIITTVSPFSKLSIEKHLRRKAKNVDVILNGVNARYFEVHEKEFSRDCIRKKFGVNKFILYVSRIEKRKNHTALLQAFTELKLYEKNISLVFIGHKTEEVKELNELLASVESVVRDAVVYLDNINEDDLLHFYRACTLFVYPSKAEGFGMPPLEAAATGVPVICSNSSAMKAFSFFGKNHIDPNSVKDLKEKISASLFSVPDPIELNRISETIRSNYTWRSSAEKLYHRIKSEAYDQL